jgi:selenophosphate synthetase-related protein
MNAAPAATAELDRVVEAVRAHPGLLGKSAIGLVSEVLGPSDWISGPGDDAAAVDALGAKLVACGEALLPSFVQADPFGAGITAVLTNVNDVAATGGVPAGIVNTIVGREAIARSVLAGLRHAGELYDVPIVGGHLTPYDGPASLSAFAVGTAREVLSVTRARSGQSLVVACALGGAMRSDFPFYAAFEQRGRECAGDVRTLAELAESGACVAAKDVSMAGLVGSLAMLLEYGALGASVDLDVLPRPGDVPVADWLTCFPSFAFLLCVPPGREDECVAPFHRRGLEAAVVGSLDDSADITLTMGGQTRIVLNVVDDPATRLATR